MPRLRRSAGNAFAAFPLGQPNPPPIVLVDGFVESAAHNQGDPKRVRMWHSLRIHLGFEPHRDDPSIEGWTLRGRTCAVWGRGFQGFLNARGNLDAVLAALGLPSISDRKPAQ